MLIIRVLHDTGAAVLVRPCSGTIYTARDTHPGYGLFCQCTYEIEIAV